MICGLMRRFRACNALWVLPLLFFAIPATAQTQKTTPETTYDEYPSIRLRSLDKITARTLTFDAQVGTTIKFGDIYIKIQSCRKPPPVERTEAAAFLQIWQTTKTQINGVAVEKATPDSRWIYSGWMFASSPALSGMDHPVYDVWVIDCLGKDPEAQPEAAPEGALPDEGTVPEGSAQAPETTPDEQVEEQAPAPTVTPQAPETNAPAETPVESEGTHPTPPSPEKTSPEAPIDGIY